VCARARAVRSIRSNAGFRSSAAAAPIRPPTDPRLLLVSRRMAATLHAKINRKRLDKLDIIKIW
jgi:hypothetical protein